MYSVLSYNGMLNSIFLFRLMQVLLDRSVYYTKNYKWEINPTVFLSVCNFRLRFHFPSILSSPLPSYFLYLVKYAVTCLFDNPCFFPI